MAEGLSAVAVKALPLAVARASWSAMRMPRANDTVGRHAAMAQASAKGWAVFIVGRNWDSKSPADRTAKLLIAEILPPLVSRRSQRIRHDAEFISFSKQ